MDQQRAHHPPRNLGPIRGDGRTKPAPQRLEAVPPARSFFFTTPPAWPPCSRAQVDHTEMSKSASQFSPRGPAPRAESSTPAGPTPSPGANLGATTPAAGRNRGSGRSPGPSELVSAVGREPALGSRLASFRSRPSARASALTGADDSAPPRTAGPGAVPAWLRSRVRTGPTLDRTRRTASVWFAGPSTRPVRGRSG